jgi:hypothetical protein
MYRLYGAAVAVTFLILCPQWVRLSTMDGSEPVFLCLLLGAWLAYRSDRTLIAVMPGIAGRDDPADWRDCSVRLCGGDGASPWPALQPST